MTDDKLLPFCFPAVCRKKITAAFDGGGFQFPGLASLPAQGPSGLGDGPTASLAGPRACAVEPSTHLTARTVAVLLRPGKTPSGTEIRGHLRRLVNRIRRHWPQTRITIRGDGHYARPQVMEWCDENDIDFVFGLPGNTVLDRLVDAVADDIRTRRALDQKPCLRGFAETSYQAKSWHIDRRACARIEAPTKGLDIRFVVTSIETGSAEHIYQTLYCARGQAENLIKLHKAQLASDRTSCRSPLANQMRLILHTAAYWLMLTVRDAIPKAHALATAEFNTIRLRLLKLGARVVETVSRVRLAFAAAAPDATLIRYLTAALMPAGP